MPLTIPTLDDRSYQQLVDDALARIPVHNPEWTNFNDSDPGVTLLQVFAFLTENLLYRSNQIPERNRLKFLSLLNVPLRAAASARGIVTLNNDRGPLQTITLNDGLEVRAGQVPFRTTAGLDVLPLEAQVYYKKELPDADQSLKDYYAQLYASYLGQPPDANQLRLYQTTPLPPRGIVGVDLGAGTLDRSLWVALLVRTGDKPYAERMADVRDAIKGKTISLGLAPYVPDTGRVLAAGGQTNSGSAHLLHFQIPKIPATGGLDTTSPALRVPQYQTLTTGEIPNEPTVVQITLPDDVSQLALWNNFDPLEAGTLDFPPALDDTTFSDRVVTWLRILAPAGAQFQVLWTGINATFVNQRAHISNQVLPEGTGEPDQVLRLAKTPVIPDSVQLAVTTNGQTETWQLIDDLTAAGPEVPSQDLRQPPGYPPVENTLVNVFALNPESGEIRFGDGTRGRRPPLSAIMRASYDYGVGRAGNVGPDAITLGPALPAGVKVTNPLRTWGGAEAETVSEGEKQIARYLQHRDRLVNATDFQTITLRTPGVDIGRVEVIPASNPDLGQSVPGDAPGAVTLMVIPKYDPAHPDTPEPDQTFLNTICNYLDSRRLVTTEVFLRGPKYQRIWISVGINIIGGTQLNANGTGLSVAEVREAVKQAILDYLSPLPMPDTALDTQQAALGTPQFATMQNGWALNKPVVDRELMAVASRVSGVLSVSDVLLIRDSGDSAQQISMNGLQLPRVAGISVSVGAPVDVKQLRGQPVQALPTDTPPAAFKPVPVVPEECQ